MPDPLLAGVKAIQIAGNWLRKVLERSRKERRRRRRARAPSRRTAHGQLAQPARRAVRPPAPADGLPRCRMAAESGERQLGGTLRFSGPDPLTWDSLPRRMWLVLHADGDPETATLRRMA